MKKLVALFLALTLLVSCGIVFADAPEGYPEVITDANGNPIDLGGMVITLYDYWSGEGLREDEPDAQTQAMYDYQDWLMETYNFTMTQKALGDWGSQAQEIINFVGTPDGSYRLCILPPDFALTPMNQNMFAAWDFDFSADKWLTSTVNFMTKGGKVYGTAVAPAEPRGLLYFNKRVLEEAGIDWETLYDMQAEGTWTWEAFEAMLKQITKDTDNDGVIDIWGMTGSNVDMYILSVFSNNGSFFDFDEDGKLVITAGSNNALEALTWSKDIFNTYFYQQPADGQWDYYKTAWKQGFCGFYMYQAYGGFSWNGGEMGDMEDEWGAVAFPIGPKGEGYVTNASDNVTIIPNVYTEDELAKIIFAYDLWTNPTPGYEEYNSRLQDYFYNLTDDRAVDETYDLLCNAEVGRVNYALFIGSLNDVLGADYLWSLAYSTPAELLEAKTPVWQGLLDIYNAQ